MHAPGTAAKPAAKKQRKRKITVEDIKARPLAAHIFLQCVFHAWRLHCILCPASFDWQRQLEHRGSVIHGIDFKACSLKVALSARLYLP